MEHAGHALELELETLERLRPTLGQLALDGLADRSRIGRTRRRSRGEEARGLADLGADARQELGPCCHFSVGHCSWKVWGARAGRSRVRVHSVKARGTLRIRPSRANGRCSSRASGLLQR